MIVMKFGGTSTQDAGAIRNVAKIVKERIGRKPVVVISAIAEATNMLEQSGRLACQGNGSEARAVLDKLFARHYAILDALVKDTVRHASLKSVISASLAELYALIDGIAILRELTPRTLDSLCCFGELLSSRLVAAAFLEEGIPARWVDTADFMVTDENFTRANPVWHVVEERLTPIILPLVRDGSVPVTQGFIGVTTSGRRTTMGRESSDFSASIVGSVLRAEDIQIWTDVDGVLTADPRIVPAPKKIRELSFEEAYELSYFGAKVLHPKTMLPALERNIPLHIYNSRHPHLSGTSIIAGSTDSDSVNIKSVAYKRGVSIIDLAPKKRLSQYMLWEHVHNILTRYDVSAAATVTSEYNYAFAIDSKSPIPAILQDLGEIGIARLSEGMGIVCLVGRNLRESPGLLTRVFRSISGIPISMVSFGASRSSLCLLVPDAEVPDAVRNIHSEFFGKDSNPHLFETLEHLVSQPA